MPYTSGFIVNVDEGNNFISTILNITAVNNSNTVPSNLEIILFQYAGNPLVKSVVIRELFTIRPLQFAVRNYPLSGYGFELQFSFFSSLNTAVTAVGFAGPGGTISTQYFLQNDFQYIDRFTVMGV
ncbi:hypothetical protein SY83_03305 [Paenibacillus swuensis]|uniref:Uncharacterized protein n=1 Tax=Paenibacillus swuensis TaxID=1178515 RepID=A0A172TEY9_9BACL|nr:hypothetical protein [Paenibacillus swuensis]ANE45506.1 hypothetical protein SY83_03305 [Paenibacillus swuensis]